MNYFNAKELFTLGLQAILALLCLPNIVAAPPNVAAPASLITSSVKLRVDAGNAHAW
jgi:hypothetical protein